MGPNVYSPDGTRIAVASSIGIWLYNVHTGAEIALFTGHTDWIYSVSFLPDGNTLASGSSDDTVCLWDVASRQEKATLQGHTDYVHSVSFSPDDNMLASASSDGTILLWDMSPYITYHAGDFDGDLDVDILDLLAFSEVYGLTSSDPNYDARMDMDNNGVIDVLDLLLFAEVYGKTYS